MRLVGWIGVLLIIGGIIVVVMRGIPYTKSRNEVEVGPVKVTSQERGYVPPIIGFGAIIVGGVLVFAGRKRTV
jgi:drug/metabolite transporter (DMT)-like permease